MPKAVAAVSLLLTLLAPSVQAQPTVTDSPWHEDLARVESLLEAGDFREGRKRVETLLRRMIERYAAYRARSESFARALAFGAVTEMAAGEGDAARWHWNVARGLSRPVRDLDLTVFGEPGRRLAEVSWRSIGEIPQPYRTAVAGDSGAGYLPPMLESQDGQGLAIPCDAVEYSRDDVPGVLRMELVVDVDGRPHAPRLLTRVTHPAYAFLALEQVRQWRWSPAQRGGQAVTALETMRIEFPCSRTW